jgi:hypothetical protein
MMRYFSVSAATWGDKIELPAFEFGGSRALNVGRSGSATFHVKDPGVAEVVTLESIAPLARVLVAEEDGNAVYAGFIVDIDEDLHAGTVTVGHYDGTAPDGPKLTWSGRSLATLANLVVAKGMDGDPADKYDLPLIMSADVAGTHKREYEGYKFITVEDALQEIINTYGGPYVDFDVRWAAGTETLEWVMRSGDLTSGFWEWDATAEKSEVSQPRLKTNADKIANRVIATGEGSGEDMIARSASLFIDNMPAIERVSSYQDIHDGTQLQDRAWSDLYSANQTTKQFSFRIPVGGTVKLGDLILGGTCRVKTTGFRFLGAGWNNWRLIQYDFDRDWITLQMQMIGG